MDEKIVKQMEEALAEAKSEPTTTEPVNTGQAEQPNTESSTEEVVSDAGLFLSEKQEESLEMPSHGEDLDARETRDAPSSATERSETDEVFPPAGDPSPTHVPEVIGERDWESEWRELAQAHPEVVGKPLPDDIYQACMQSDQPPLRVYESMMLSRQAAEIDSLKREIETLKQNAESASRAPVSAVTGGKAGSEPEDAFVKAFWSY